MRKWNEGSVECRVIGGSGFSVRLFRFSVLIGGNSMGVKLPISVALFRTVNDSHLA